MSQDQNIDYRGVLERFVKDLDGEIAFKKSRQNVLHMIKKSFEGQYGPEQVSEIKGYYEGLETARHLLDFAMFKQGMADGIESLRGDTDGDPNGNDSGDSGLFGKKSTKELGLGDLFALLLLGSTAMVLSEDEFKRMLDKEAKKGQEAQDQDGEDGEDEENSEDSDGSGSQSQNPDNPDGPDGMSDADYFNKLLKELLGGNKKAADGDDNDDDDNDEGWIGLTD